MSHIAKESTVLWILFFICYVLNHKVKSTLYWVVSPFFLLSLSFLFLLSLSFPLSFSMSLGKVPRHLPSLCCLQVPSPALPTPILPNAILPSPAVWSRHCCLHLMYLCFFLSPLHWKGPFVVQTLRQGLLVLSVFDKWITVSLNHPISISGKATQTWRHEIPKENHFVLHDYCDFFFPSYTELEFRVYCLSFGE